MNTKFIKIVTLAAGLVVPAAALAQPLLTSLSSTGDSSAIVARLQETGTDGRVRGEVLEAGIAHSARLLCSGKGGSPASREDLVGRGDLTR
jgi:hypothetical protein